MIRDRAVLPDAGRLARLALLAMLALPALLASPAICAWPAHAVAAPPAAIAVPVLRSHATVLADRVRLGDVFLNAGPAADAVIADAPAAGRQLVLPAATLARLARGYGLAWRPVSGAEQVVIERESVVVDDGEILALLADGLAAKGLTAGLSIELTSAAGGLRIPATARLALESLAYSPGGRRFSAMLVALDGDRAVQRTALAGQVFRVVQLPVAARDLRQGEIIGHADLDRVAVRDGVVPANAVLDADAMVGLTPRRALRAGQPIAAADLGRPQLVAKGALVTLVLASRGMTLSARGRALDAGGAGDTVRVANLGSNTVVEGVVTAAGEVRVQGAFGGRAGR